MIDPLEVIFDVACPADHAFTTWTAKIASWWAPDHTVTGRADTVVVLQEGVGGRIYERSADGEEHDWGEITVWDPPRRLGYLWHLGSERANATEVEIRFVPRGHTSTRVEIAHRGWERLGDTAETWRNRNRIGWQTLLPHFITASQEGATRWPLEPKTIPGS
jgi:uncharacterized protein YndB with AHSA1/START domain